MSEAIKVKPTAKAVFYGLPDMSVWQRRAIVLWLRGLADDVANLDNDYASTFKATYTA